MRSYLSRFWIAVAVLPLAAGTALASGPAMFVCRGDSIARVTCCCPAVQHRATPRSTTPTLSAACCCDMSQMTTPTAPAVQEPRTVTLLVHQSAFTPVFGGAIASFASDHRTWPTARARLAKPPPLVIPILLGKQSLLI
jgi:hypothetical protein